MFSPSWRPIIMYLPSILRGNSAMPLLRAALPVIGTRSSARKSRVRSSSDWICEPL